MRRTATIFLLCFALRVLAQDTSKGPYPPTPEEMTALISKVKQLEQRLAAVKGKPEFADAAIYLKAAQWCLKYSPKEFFTKNDYKFALAGLERGLERAT